MLSTAENMFSTLKGRSCTVQDSFIRPTCFKQLRRLSSLQDWALRISLSLEATKPVVAV